MSWSDVICTTASAAARRTMAYSKLPSPMLVTLAGMSTGPTNVREQKQWAPMVRKPSGSMSLRVPLQALSSRTSRTVSGMTNGRWRRDERALGDVASSGAPSTSRGKARRSVADTGATMALAAFAAASRAETAVAPLMRAWAADENWREGESGAGGPATR